MSIEEKNQKDRFIEVWRGIAVLLVVAYHYTNRIPYEIMGSPAAPILPFYSGKIGVLIFFVISGFLISASLNYSKSLAHFYAKRLSRLWPLFLLATTATFLFLQVFQAPIVPDGPKMFYTRDITWVDLIGNWFFLEDFGFNWVDGAYWSIVVELKFYFLIGLAAAIWPGDHVRKFSVFCIVTGALALLFQADVLAHVTKVQMLLNGLFVAQYLPFFAVGVLLYGRERGALLSVAIILAMAQTGEKIASNPDLEIAGTIRFLLVFALIVGLDAQLFRQKIMLFFGKYSYSLYLFHQMLGVTLIDHLVPDLPIDIAILIAFGVATFVAWAGSRMVEWRFRNEVEALLASLMGRLGLANVRVSGGSPPSAAKTTT